jgi:restriction system protein
MNQDEIRSLTPFFPTYPIARHFLRIVHGVSYSLYRSMYNMIMEQRGNPQAVADWADPNEWIPERLSGQERDLALRFWHESQYELNPRYVSGKWHLCMNHDLLTRDRSDVLRVTEKGEYFLVEDANPVIAEIDAYEGVLNILQVVAEKGPGRRSEFLNEYADYCQRFTSYRAETVIKASLYARLVNLVDRSYVAKNGFTYEVTDAGLDFLDKYAHLIAGRGLGSKQSEIVKLAREMSKHARSQLAEYVLQMNPFKFEALVKLLLEEMGYTDVIVTSPTNDKGVDVIGSIELGISSVREVVQVKRHRGNIQRDILDRLRGSLHRFDAVRGTIITTGGFSSGTKNAAFEKGAAPITLIDGDKLLDLLMEYNIGIAKKSIDYIEFDQGKLAQFAPKEADEPNE